MIILYNNINCWGAQARPTFTKFCLSLWYYKNKMANNQQQIYIPDGIVSEFAAHAEVNEEEASKRLLDRVQAVTDLYKSNSMQAFWRKDDVLALHIIASNHLLNRLDTSAAIDDLDVYEEVYQYLENTLTGWITEKKRGAFDASIKVCYNLSEKSFKALLNILSIALQWLAAGGSDGVEASCDDDNALFSIFEASVNQESKKGWAAVRLQLVSDTLTALKKGEEEEGQEVAKSPVSSVESSPKAKDAVKAVPQKRTLASIIARV
jgi:hypothetical protein